jgi:hypothetical protein
LASRTIVETSHGISVGSVFGRSLAAIRANALPMFGISFAFMALPQLLLGQVGLRAAVFHNFRQGQ